MPKKKMKFPEVPGDTPRERFTNLVRHVISLPKAAVGTGQKSKRRKSAKGFGVLLFNLTVISIEALALILFEVFPVLAQDADQSSYQIDHYYELAASSEAAWATPEDMIAWYQHRPGALDESGLDAFSKDQVKEGKECDIHVHTMFQITAIQEIQIPFSALVSTHPKVEYVRPTSGNCAGKRWWISLNANEATPINH
jgi:hypothetical protein